MILKLQIEKRLQGLEKHVGEKMLLIVESADGTQREMDVDEYIISDSIRFICVKKGSRLTDVDRILAKIGAGAKLLLDGECN